MQASVKSVYDCIKQFSKTDFTADLARIEVPTLVAHGDDDQIVPIRQHPGRHGPGRLGLDAVDAAVHARAVEARSGSRSGASPGVA
jgi:pimeloyl-ACP methyl ester carboxylesterase